MAGAAGEAPPLLCRGGCGFYGSAANDGMCSRCASGNVITAQPQPQPTTAGTAAAGSDDAAVRRLGGFGDRQLRAVIVSAGLSHDDCTSLEQLRERARQAMTSSTTGSTAAGGGGSTHGGGVQMMEVQRRELAGLACTLVGSRGCLRGAATIELAVLIMHGFSASAADLVPICESIGANTGALQGRRVVFVLPQAPGQPSAWWTIDVMQWAMALMGGGGIEQLTRMRHPGLDHARTRGLTLLAAIQQLGCAAGAGTPLPMARVVIGGFSQGAMTAVDLALQLPPDGQCGGVMALSGAPIVVGEWAERLRLLRAVEASLPPVLVTHGTMDPVLPFAVSGLLRRHLERGGCAVRMQQHGGGHELGPATVVAAITTFWAEIAAAADDHDADADGVAVANADSGVDADAPPAKHTDDVEGAGGAEDAELALALAMSLEGIDTGTDE